ncbi:hypothetical protein ABZS86_16655 [Streptomyces sp. NPDC005355]|uniref:SbtR family transcriptional regulator n=1 Tax=Streptomyces sp. NPDC005355 TaxID=3157038 RepID=UPI0033A48C90
MALGAWLSAATAQISTSRGLTASVVAAGSADASWCHRALEAAAASLLDRAQRHRSVRPDVSVPQLLKLVNAVALATEHQPEPDRAQQAAALLDLLMDGLRSRAAH